jgi:hypothetical protein
MDDFQGIMNDALRKESCLAQLLAELTLNDGPDHWKRIELTAQDLANALRIKDPKGIRKYTSHTPAPLWTFWGIQAIKTITQMTNTQLWAKLIFRRPSTNC